MDLYSQKILGWAMADLVKTELAGDAMSMAVIHVKSDGELLRYSDCGVQSACDDYQPVLVKLGINSSMSPKGDWPDNAPTQSA